MPIHFNQRPQWERGRTFWRPRAPSTLQALNMVRPGQRMFDNGPSVPPWTTRHSSYSSYPTYPYPAPKAYCGPKGRGVKCDYGFAGASARRRPKRSMALSPATKRNIAAIKRRRAFAGMLVGLCPSPAPNVNDRMSSCMGGYAGAGPVFGDMVERLLYWADENSRERDALYAEWHESLAAGEPNTRALVDALSRAYGAVTSYTDVAEESAGPRAMRAREQLADAEAWHERISTEIARALLACAAVP